MGNFCNQNFGTTSDRSACGPQRQKIYNPYKDHKVGNEVFKYDLIY